MSTIEALRAHADAICERELERVGRRLSPVQLEAADTVARSIVTRFLYTPAIRLDEEASPAHARALRRLFDLDESPRSL